MSGVTGEQLYEELCAAAARARTPLMRFVAPIYKDSSHLQQLRIANTPKASTIDRIRALIAGQQLPERTSLYPRKGSVVARESVENRIGGDEIEHRRRLTERAHLERRPGETLQSAVKRIAAAEGGAHG